MEANNIISNIWKEETNFIVESFIHNDFDKLSSATALLSNIFCAGPSYYYILDFQTRKIDYISPSVTDILGLDPEKVTFNDIVDCVHPEDLIYIEIAERFNLAQLNKLTKQQIAQAKLAYCFREKMRNGDYELFQLQAVWIKDANSTAPSKLVNIHTNIHHLTPFNNYILTLSSVLDHSFFFRYDLKNQLQLATKPTPFSDRELEIIRLIANGLTSGEIAKHLFLSSHTIKTHRKNICKKAGVSTSAQLVTYCVNEGLL